MSTTTALVFAYLPTGCQKLVMNFMPKAIHDKVYYENTMEIVDALVDYRIG